ncbi:hypothetical protein HMPREF1862_01654 [Varibaculum cambriense]|uniref:Uncharacterized protein n=1 Tax=Varibaculum cambriense TaxID=184870 RepID=A0AB34WXS4_9ACTO|nr:hypothetical protein HMPREF1862_01654 [Varibaculum cambriense]
MKSLAKCNICNTRTNSHNSYGIFPLFTVARTVALSNLTFRKTLVSTAEN